MFDDEDEELVRIRSGAVNPRIRPRSYSDHSDPPHAKRFKQIYASDTPIVDLVDASDSESSPVDFSHYTPRQFNGWSDNRLFDYAKYFIDLTGNETIIEVLKEDKNEA
ncbi:hypothetical protein HDU85_001629, partial [Gaertneriomyces sp. JEL0708]